MRISTHKSGTILAAHISKEKVLFPYFIWWRLSKYPECPYQEACFHPIRIFHVTSRVSGISINDQEFPESDLEFHIRSRISISDLKILYMIQNFLFLSRTSISNPEIPACLIGMPSLWSLKMRCMWIGMVQKDTIISEALNIYFKSENSHFNTGSTKFFTSRVVDRKVMELLFIET